jgi:hypothetical protein
VETSVGEGYDDANADDGRLPTIPMVPLGAGTIQTRMPFQTAIEVRQPRDLARVEREVLKQAMLLGEDAFYAWGSGKNHVEGGTISLATAMMQAYGNAVVVAEPVQETAEAWYLTHTFVDLERGISLPRQFRQSKREPVAGSMDSDRADQVRFGKGQSKSIRNAILLAMPQYMVTKAIEEAKKSARAKMEKFIADKGLAAAQAYTVGQLKRHGVTEEQILAKMGKVKVDGLDLDDLVKLSADFRLIDPGNETASALVGEPLASASKIDLKEKLKSQVERGGKGDAEAKAVTDMNVRLGHEPSSWIANDGMKEYLLVKRGNDVECNCQRKNCLHLLALARFTAAPHSEASL